MVFSSIVFLCIFFPAVILCYYLCPKSLRNLFLLLASLLFYAWGEPKYILIMLFSTVFDYCNGRLLEYFEVKKKDTDKVRYCSLYDNKGTVEYEQSENFRELQNNEIMETFLALYEAEIDKVM